MLDLDLPHRSDDLTPTRWDVKHDIQRWVKTWSVPKEGSDVSNMRLGLDCVYEVKGRGVDSAWEKQWIEM